MSELGQRLRWARVDYSATIAESAWGLMSHAPEIRGPGLTQADAVQVVTELAALRDLVGSWNIARVAEFFPGGGSKLWTAYGRRGLSELVADIERRGSRAMPVVGDAPLVQFGAGVFGGSTDVTATNPTTNWGPNLALALDQVMVGIGKAELGPNIPIGGQQVADLVALQLAFLAVIVAGAALSVIGSVAAWRFLDPEFRRDATIVRQAAQNYAQRLDQFEKTGTMPPASDIEQQAAPTVLDLAKQRSGSGWLMGGLVAGGLGVGFVLAGLLTRGMREEAA
ncbi:MAG TPA: hypothetical protein VN896_07930 [Methylomirabilota bacterium]|nr:hypothetical protein [Methylomirabilota bacterium]